MPQRRRRALLAALPLLPLAGAAFSRDLGGESRPKAAPASGGRLVRHARLSSRFVAARDVRVWLPPDYEEGEPSSVLYMHDGQNLFAPANPFDHGPWDVDRHLLALRAQGRVRKTMVVAIDNAGVDRSREYSPQAALAALPAELRRKAIESERPLADAYVRALAEELKPYIDARYRTRPGPEDTVLLGSSRGGLISYYALCQQPELFGAAGGLSMHWIVTTDPGQLAPAGAGDRQVLASSVLAWLRAHLPPAGRHRLYLDHGDQGLDAFYAPFQQRMDAIAAEKGYQQGSDYLSRVFPGAAHDEAAWRARLAIPLVFLLPPGP